MHSFTPRQAFDLLKDWMDDPDYRLYWAESLHDADDGVDLVVVHNEARGFPEYAGVIEYVQPDYDAFWRLAMWNNRRLDLGKH